jgi:hypothetical protein
MFEYKEVVSKKTGKHTVFCKFEDLLKDAFQTESVEEAKSKAHVQNGEYICHCPFCKAQGHTKHKLYLTADLSQGHCFVCTRAFINVVDDIDTSYQVPQFMRPTGGLNLVRLNDPDWTIDRYFTEFDDYDEKGLDFLFKRDVFLKYLWKPLGFKFWDGNIVMPFKYKDEVFYYQIRFTSGNKIRYYFPPVPAGSKPPYIIEIGDCKKLIICEGVYDAISLLVQAPGYTPVAVLGSHITDYQIEFLREYVPDKILVYMDDTEKSIGVARKLKSVIDYCPIGVIKSNGPDPEETLRKKLYWGKKLQWIK